MTSAERPVASSAAPEPALPPTLAPGFPMPRFSLDQAQRAGDEWGNLSPSPTPDVDYRPISNFPRYLLGSNGELWSRQRGKWKRLSSRPDKHGYLRVKLCRDRIVFERKLHKLVMEVFVGPCPRGFEVAHGDGSKVNCQLSNLRYDTHKGNHGDRIAHGTSNAGQANGMSRLTENDVREIKRRHGAGDPKCELIREFGVGRRAIERILRGERWKHIPV